MRLAQRLAAGGLGYQIWRWGMLVAAARNAQQESSVHRDRGTGVRLQARGLARGARGSYMASRCCPPPAATPPLALSRVVDGHGAGSLRSPPRMML